MSQRSDVGLRGKATVGRKSELPLLASLQQLVEAPQLGEQDCLTRNGIWSDIFGK